jgi:hypothetical protein
VTLFWPLLDPRPSPMCHLVTLERTPGSDFPKKLAFFLWKSRPKYKNMAQNFGKMSRNTLANPLPCGIWWHCPVHPPTPAPHPQSTKLWLTVTRLWSQKELNECIWFLMSKTRKFHLKLLYSNPCSFRWKSFVPIPTKISQKWVSSKKSFNRCICFLLSPSYYFPFLL